jgi:hypothetical protein
MNRTLFDISDDLIALEQILDEVGGDVSDAEAEHAVDKWLEGLGEERDRKLESYAWLIKRLEGDADILKAEMDRLRLRKQTAENKARRLKERLEMFMKITGDERIQTERFTFSLQKPGGKPKVELGFYFQDHPEELPEGLRRVKFEPDLEAIRERLEAKDPDVQCIAGFAYSEKKLRIR